MAKNLQSSINVGAKPNYNDDRFWKISKDENGKGAAIIRLIPDKNLTPFIKMFHYSLKRPNPTQPGKYLWYIAKSPDIIGLPDPVKEYYMNLIGEKTTESQEESKKFSRQTKFVTNILVIKDPANPDNNGKVFLWEFGVKLLEKFNSWIKPSEQELVMDQKPMNIFHPVEGYNITLKIRPDQFSFTYDDTTINTTPCSIHPKVVDEASAKKFIDANTYELNELLKPESFDSYETLKAKFEKYLGKNSSEQAPTKIDKENKFIPKEDNEIPEWMDGPAKKTEETKVKTEKVKTEKVKTEKVSVKAEEENDDWLNEL
jgi:hypothetical protein